MKDYAFSKYIVALRHKYTLTRFDLARKLGIGYLTVAKWENAEALPTREELEKLSVFFNLSCAAIRAHSFVELPGCSVKPPVKKPEPEIITAPDNEAPTPAPVEPKPTPAPVEPKPTPAPVEPKPTPAPVEPKPTPAPALESEPVAAPTPSPLVTAAPAPVETAPVEEPARECEEPIASSENKPVLDFSFMINPQTQALAEKKRIEMKNEEIVSSYKRFGVKIRRLFAAAFDMLFSLLCVIVFVVAASIITTILMIPEDLASSIAAMAGGIVCALVYVLRDALVGGTSLGKRILGLYVVDMANATKPVVWQRAVRTLGQVFASTVDAIVLLVCGRSIGDWIAGTVVVSRKDYNNRFKEKDPLDPPVKVRKNRTGITAFLIITAVGLVTALVVAFGYFMQVMLENEKQTEEYLYAYDALIVSEEFAETGADPAELIFTSFYRYSELKDGGAVNIVEYTFETEEYYIYVTVESSVDGIIVTDITAEPVSIYLIVE